MTQTQKNHRRKCPPGYVKRRAYTRKTGTHVKSVCIKSTSPYLQKPKNNRLTMRRRLQALFGTRKACPPGQIPRAAYVRKISSTVAREGYTKRTQSGKHIRVYPKPKSIFVKSSCVEDVGKAGKGPQIFGPLRKGELSKYGYSYKLPETQRRSALQSAVQEYGALSTYRKLNAVAKLSSTANPKASSAFASDRNWIRKTYANASGTIRAF
jgi:hypothetical protein